MNYSTHAPSQVQDESAHSRWDLPRSVPLAQWLAEQDDGLEPPAGSQSFLGNFTKDRQELSMLLAAFVESAGDRLEGRIGTAARRGEARRLQVIGECLTTLLIQPRSVATTERVRAELAAAGIPMEAHG